MISQGRQLGVRGAQAQARAFHARERLRSLAGVPELFRTHRYDIPTASIPATSFPTRSTPVTFATSIRIDANAGVHQGLIFEIGNADAAVAAWVDDDQIGFRAGALTTNRALASYTTGTGELAVGRIFHLVMSAKPGTGEVRLWAGSSELARDTASAGSFPVWANAFAGAFATAANGGLPADVPQFGAPNGFTVVAPLSVYVGQAPRHFT